MTLDETRYKSHCTVNVNVDSKLNLKGNALSYFSPYLVAFQFFLKIKRTSLELQTIDIVVVL